MQNFKDVECAGYADWLLPTIDELKTLVYCSKGMDDKNLWCNYSSEEPTINQQAFPNTEAWAYWSGSSYASFSLITWSVNFHYGASNINFAVRLVRGP